MKQFDVPILLLVFNRLDTTVKVFSEIKNQHPKKLFVASDGPREDKIGELESVNNVREYILKNIDWPCEVKTLFRTKNLGCKIAASSAITWFFENVEEGIILEDDCLPDVTFFRFCQELLEKYRDVDSIMSIGGSNFQNGIKRNDFSYYYSSIIHVWGWATWRRAWSKYDLGINNLSEFIEKKVINNYFGSFVERKYWIDNFKDARDGKIDTWDYAWFECCLYNSGLTCVPNRNLIKNIGLGHKDATHTTQKIDELIVDLEPLDFPLSHPPIIKRDESADSYFNNKSYGKIQRKAVAISLLKQIKIYYLINMVFKFLFRKK